VIHSIVFSTLGQLATGILFFIAFVPPSRIGKGFAQFHTALAAALWAVAIWGHFSPSIYLLGSLLLLVFLFASRDVPYYIFLCASALLSLLILIRPEMLRLGVIPAITIHLPAVLVLGSAAVAMLLGHWYLVSPKLSIRYLQILTIGLIVSILLRSGMFVEVIMRSREQLSQMHFYEIYGIFVLQRVALGLLLTLALSILTYFCVKIRSTQSATGILYVVLVFCLIGELIAAYLFAKTGVSF
jgi:hypothetical protein